jgi:SSS family solute:Na+ symporter
MTGISRTNEDARKLFFFEKKNQKTFAKLGSLYPGTPKPEEAEVFCCFFSKKTSFLPLPDVRQGMTLVFAGLVALSLLVASASRRHAHQDAKDFFVASGQFGLLFFFLAVGETYSIATILGFPGGVYAHGTGFVSWFIGYILLAFPVGYFLYPEIWRAGRRYSAVTLPDIFARHFNSRALEIVISSASVVFLLPLGVMQFLGLNTVLSDLGWPVPRLLLSGLGGLLAFTYIAISGIRAPAFVAVLKDGLMLAAILITGIACLGQMPPAGAARPAMPAQAAAAGDVFAISTILLQCIGFCVVPQTCAAIFSARSVSAVRRAQIAMPLYMVMFPFLMIVALYAVRHDVHPLAPDEVFLAVARTLLPGWAVGLVMAGAALSAIVVLTGVCLSLGPLVTRNLVPGLSGDQQQLWSKCVIAVYLLLSLTGAAHSNALMVALNNLFYFGVTQIFPGLLAIIQAWKVDAGTIIVGLLAGEGAAIALHFTGLPLGGCNPGLVGLALNLAIVCCGRWKEGLLF